MKGEPKVIEYLKAGLRHELTAVNQYWLHYRLLDHWGYKALAKYWRKESIEEMQHADRRARGSSYALDRQELSAVVLEVSSFCAS